MLRAMVIVERPDGEAQELGVRHTKVGQRILVEGERRRMARIVRIEPRPGDEIPLAYARLDD